MGEKKTKNDLNVSPVFVHNEIKVIRVRHHQPTTCHFKPTRCVYGSSIIAIEMDDQMNNSASSVSRQPAQVGHERSLQESMDHLMQVPTALKVLAVLLIIPDLALIGLVLWDLAQGTFVSSLVLTSILFFTALHVITRVLILCYGIKDFASIQQMLHTHKLLAHDIRGLAITVPIFLLFLGVVYAWVPNNDGHDSWNIAQYTFAHILVFTLGLFGLLVFHILLSRHISGALHKSVAATADQSRQHIDLVIQ